MSHVTNPFYLLLPNPLLLLKLVWFFDPLAAKFKASTSPAISMSAGNPRPSARNFECQ
jgi:hypothetical protein